MMTVCPNCGFSPNGSGGGHEVLILTETQRQKKAPDILAAVTEVMEVALADLPGRITPRTKPRLQWARNMAALVMHDLGMTDGAIAGHFGCHRVSIVVRRRRMIEQIANSQRYRDFRAAIMARLDQPKNFSAEQAGNLNRKVSA